MKYLAGASHGEGRGGTTTVSPTSWCSTVVLSVVTEVGLLSEETETAGISEVGISELIMKSLTRRRRAYELVRAKKERE